MKWRFTWWWFTMLCGWPAMAGVPLTLLANREPERIFAGAAKNISVTFSNHSDENVDAVIQVRMLQTSSSTATQFGGWPWKKLEVLPRQTVLESAALDFPAVRAKTEFLVEWLTDTNHVIGKTVVMVYPTNLLFELKNMFTGDDLGVLDPGDVLKPILRQNHVEFLNLDETALDDFSGKLAVVGPFESKAQWREGFPKAVQRIAMKGAAVVWIQPPPNTGSEIKPSFYLVPEGKGAVVIVQPDLLADFPKNPASQLNLIQFCKLALNPAPFGVPNFRSQP